MKLSSAILLIGSLASASAFAPARVATRAPSSLNIVPGDKQDVADKVKEIFAKGPKVDAAFDKIVQERFPGAINNQDLVTKTVDILAGKGYSGSNTLLATSLCCDELARQLEDDFNQVYGNNFNLGGLSGFPFAGNTGFGAMAAHIPDDGYCLVVYGPHVGIAADGTVGKVERSGIALVDTCCGSAVAASNYLKGITDGGAVITTKLQEFSDFQQGAVQELILPHGKRLAEAKDRMIELPYALYDSQDMLMRDIVTKGSNGIKRGLALLGGIQINTGPNTLDYFVPMRFDYMNYRGDVAEEMLPQLVPQVIPHLKNEEETNSSEKSRAPWFLRKFVKSS
mmetsp:Transcript_7685/g.14498  ORF Transcript_7685/g.14498 Transcript_7685/m.14498 type:complete len:339 (-) Transcript_7685:130-1146(-)